MSEVTPERVRDLLANPITTSDGPEGIRFHARLFDATPAIAEAYLDAEARIAAGLALADQWAAVDGVDQRAATLHTVADRLREALGKSGQP